ncbi:MAG: hypothetical protein M1823_005139 [Watsoniomyces obsoletus]|nr:MAG: hypothetical protein M1823_005139 [Watsoniomyces obsoletus]
MSNRLQGFEQDRHPVTPATLQSDLQLCEKLLSRSWTPRFTRTLERWKQSLQEAEKATGVRDINERFEYLVTFRGMLGSHLKKIKEGMTLPLTKLDQLRGLRLMKFLMDYRDYYITFNLDDGGLRRREEYFSSEWKTGEEYFNSEWNGKLSGGWMDMLRIVDGKPDNNETTPRMRTQLDNAANELGCTYEHLIWEIKTFNERKRWAHSDIKFLVVKGLWVSLAAKIRGDKDSLKNPIPLQNQEEFEELEKAIEMTERRFFKALPDAFPQYFELSDHAKKIQDRLGQRWKVERADGERQVREMVTPSGMGGSYDRMFEGFEAFSLEDLSDLWADDN